MTRKYILDFIEAVFPDAPNLAMSSFDEKHCLETATQIINEHRRDAERYRYLRDTDPAERTLYVEDESRKHFRIMSGKRLDDAIDAAMKANT
jgi:hypothetical protein